MPLDINGNWIDFSKDLMPDFSGIERNTKDGDYFFDLSSAPAPAPVLTPAKSRFCVNPLKQFGMKL